MSQGNRNVTIRGDVRGSIIATGDDNALQQTHDTLEEHTETATTARRPPDPLARQLFDALGDQFSLDEIRTLCFDLGIDFDVLTGEGKLGKARELVRLMQRRGELGQLAEAIQRERSAD